MKQIIYDANNWLRRRFETGTSVRTCYAEVISNPGIIVFDGKGGKKRRLDVYPGYKVGRQMPASTIYKQFDLFKEVCAWLPICLIEVPLWEADDVIATLVRTQQKEDPTTQFHIKSTDVDFLQLENTVIDREKAAPVPPNRIKLYKSLVGDQSDKIPGFKVFGDKAWAKLSEDDKDQLESFLKGEINYLPSNMPVATLNWLEEDENKELVRSFWHIVELWDVPMADIIANTKVGVSAPEKLEENLKRYWL